MSKIVSGKVFVVGDDIDTDQIIPAQYLNLLPNVPEERRKLGSYALTGLPDDYPSFIEEGQYESKFNIIIAGKNFGCGSSREHAPISLNAAGVQVIIAQSYSRIFFRNSVNAGLLYPFEVSSKINNQFKTGDTVDINIDLKTLYHFETSREYALNSLGDAEDIVNCGGIFEYAKKQGIS